MNESTTKLSIVENAMALMMKRGYEQVSIDEIAENSGVSKGAVYYYFPSKIDLGIETLKHYFNTLRSMMGFGKSDNPTNKLMSYLDSVADIYKQNKMGKNVCLLGLFALSSTKNDAINNKTQEYFESWIHALVPVCEEAVSMSQIGLSAYDLARQIVLTIEGALVLHAADGDTHKLVQSITSYKVTVQHALGGIK